jgi:hypothetical protein
MVMMILLDVATCDRILDEYRVVTNFILNFSPSIFIYIDTFFCLGSSVDSRLVRFIKFIDDEFDVYYYTGSAEVYCTGVHRAPYTYK